MWIATDEGFLSIVAFDPKKDKVERSKRQIKSWGKYPVLVRARLATDMEQLKPYWRKLRVEEDKSADYHVRAVMPRQRFMDFLFNKGWEIDYNSHFKEVAQARSPGGKAEGSRRHSAYMRVWTDLASLQHDAPYSGGYYSSYGGSSYSGSSYSSSSGGYSSKSDTPLSNATSNNCTHNTRFEEDGKSFVVWCSKMLGHKDAAHKMDEVYEIGKNRLAETTYKRIWNYTGKSPAVDKKVVTTASLPPGSSSSTTKTAGPTTGAPKQIYGGTQGKSTTEVKSPTSMLDNVEELCRALLVKSPEEIEEAGLVDEATPFDVYDLWAEANNQSPTKPLTPLGLLTMLDEYAQDDSTAASARNAYMDIIDRLINGEVTNIEPFDLDDDELAHYAAVVSKRDSEDSTVSALDTVD